MTDERANQIDPQADYLRTDSEFLKGDSARGLLVLNAVLAVAYFAVLALYFERGTGFLYWMLVLGGAFYLWQALAFLHSVWTLRDEPAPKLRRGYRPSVDVLITVAGEPVEVVEETARAAMAMDYPNKQVYILNDGYVAKKENWRDIEELAARLGCFCVTRTVPGGAKAGNINNGLRHATGELVLILDADHVPHPDFLQKTVPYFEDRSMGFVQSPQYYKNWRLNTVTAGAWEQQMIFFGPISRGKNAHNAATMCGTNMVIRRTALDQVGGIFEDSITEDFLTGVVMHEKGWKSRFVPEILAEGLAPEDFLSYYKQQYRWARGALDLIFNSTALYRPGLSLSQRIEYLSSVTYFLSGLFVVMNALVPLVFFYTGLVPFEVTTMTLAAFFLPYILVTLYVLQRAGNYTFTFRALAFSMGGFIIYLKALLSVVTGRKESFAITSKTKLDGNFLYLVKPHVAYMVLLAVGIAVAIVREGFNPSVVANIAWASITVAAFSEFIRAAMPERAESPKTAVEGGRVPELMPEANQLSHVAALRNS